MRRIVALVPGLVLASLLIAPATAVAAPRSVTFHGTFDGGQGWWSTAPWSDPVIALPLAGDWNLNINMNLAPDEGRAKAVVVVRYPEGGLHALWTPSAVTLEPLTTESPLSALIPELDGAVNAPADGIYIYQARLTFMDATMVFYYNDDTKAFFYAAMNGVAYTCPAPSPDVVFCFDRLQVSGTGGR